MIHRICVCKLTCRLALCAHGVVWACVWSMCSVGSTYVLSPGCLSSWCGGSWKTSFVAGRLFGLVTMVCKQELWSLWPRYFYRAEDSVIIVSRTPMCLREGWMDTTIFASLTFLFSPVFLSLASCFFLDPVLWDVIYTLTQDDVKSCWPWNHFISLRWLCIFLLWSLACWFFYFGTYFQILGFFL